MKRKRAPKIRSKPDKQPQSDMSTYIFSFELTKQYPTVRSFIIKQPLKKSFVDSMADLIGKTK